MRIANRQSVGERGGPPHVSGREEISPVRRIRQTVRQPRAYFFSAACLPIACLALACLTASGCQGRVDATATLPEDAAPVDVAKIDASVPAAPKASDDGASVDVAPVDGASVTVQLLDYAGIEQLVASHRGKVVVMDAWALSCPPCVAEFPKLVALSHQFGQDQLACISLSFDYEGIGKPEGKLERVTKFLAGQNATFDNVLGSEESDALYRKFHLASVPAVFVYDKTGTLRHRFDNQKAKSAAEHFTYEDVGRLVEQLAAEPAASN